MSDGNGSGPMIAAEGLAKHYGQTRALADGVEQVTELRSLDGVKELGSPDMSRLP